MIPTLIVPFAATVASQPGTLPMGAVQVGPLFVVDGAALAPLLLGACLWVVLMVAMRGQRDARRRAEPPVISTPPSDGVPAAA